MASPKKRWSWRLGLSLALIGGSIILYAADYLVFGRPREIAVGLMDNIAFLCIYILVVVLVVEDVLARREKKALLKKMNMVIGAFFSAWAGTCWPSSPSLSIIRPSWPPPGLHRPMGKSRVSRSHETARAFPYKVRITPAALRDLRTCLLDNRGFLLGLLENPNLLEHERFTDCSGPSSIWLKSWRCARIPWKGCPPRITPIWPGTSSGPIR